MVGCHVALLSGPTVHSLYCDVATICTLALFNVKQFSLLRRNVVIWELVKIIVTRFTPWKKKFCLQVAYLKSRESCIALAIKRER